MEASILGLVYHAHAPTAELFDDAVIRDGLPNQLRWESHCPECWRGSSGCSQPLPLRDGFLFQRDSSPACCKTRHTLAGLTATTS
jgi:hypothetical protein